MRHGTGFKNGDETVAIEGKVMHQTPKAYLIEATLGGEYWLPKSQIVSMSDPDIDGNREIVITDWIAGKNGLK